MFTWNNLSMSGPLKERDAAKDALDKFRRLETQVLSLSFTCCTSNVRPYKPRQAVWKVVLYCFLADEQAGCALPYGFVPCAQLGC